MKVSKVKSLCILFLLLFILLIVAVFGTDIKLSLVNSINLIGSEDESSNSKEDIDISKVAYGVTNGIDVSSISNIATDIERVEVFDGLTIEELSSKLNRYLKNKGVLANHGELIASECIKLGIDPYMAVAIMMHETGCNGTCSRLARVNYNVGGMKGKSGWQKFDSITDGINGFLSNLSRNYYKKGLTTPEKMAYKYAGGSTTWAGKVRSYMRKIEAA